jgi:hypothetical protein
MDSLEEGWLMYNKWIFLAALVVMMVGAASSEMTKIPASQDVYFNLGSEQVFNKTDILRCEVGYIEANGSREESFTGVPMIQFDISGLNMTDDDIGILVLKAASVEKQGNDSAMIAMLPISSEWNEESDFVEFLMNFLPIWNTVKKNDLSQMGISTDDDAIFAFDVSKKLTDAKAAGDRVSFLLLPISNSSYKVDFMSREMGQGPYLIVMPYPAEMEANLTSILPINESVSNETITIPENESLMDQTTMVAVNESTVNQTALQAL